MHQQTLKEVVDELAQLIPGRFIGKIYQLSPLSLAIDFGLNQDGLLFVSIEPDAPRLHLIKRGLRSLEKSAKPHSMFTQAMRAVIGGGIVVSVSKDDTERVVRFSVDVTDDLGDRRHRCLVAQLTGRSANLFLLEHDGIITHALRPPIGDGQLVGNAYRPPFQSKAMIEGKQISRGKFPTTSAAVDAHYHRIELAEAFEVRAASLIARQKKELAKQKKLKTNLQKDLVAHGNPDDHKRLGDLLNANISTGERAGNKVRLIDYWADGTPTIEMDLDANTSLQEAATAAFSRYAKSKRAIEEIGARLVKIDRQIVELESRQSKVLEAIAKRDEEKIAEFEGTSKERKSTSRSKRPESKDLPGLRRYISSDGYEVITGRSARDNDRLTFREARPNDLWLHAGDYPGSHVIVRNSSRKEIPHRTIVEAAQLAARFSQASKDSKVHIHYTPRKFISKPKGAAPGLVRMSSFKSITVEPGENISRI